MEKIILRVEVDGIELSPIEFGKGEQSHFYKDDIAFFKMGHLLNKEQTESPYEYLFRLDRCKTKEEKLDKGE